MLPESELRQGFVEEGDFQAIVQHLEPAQALGATIAFETAWRIRSEVLTLEWARVDLAEGCIHLDGANSKNGKPRKAHLSPDTHPDAGRAPSQGGRRPPGDRHQRLRPYRQGPLQGRRIKEFNETWRGACRRAGYTGTLLH
jgi:integrase